MIWVVWKIGSILRYLTKRDLAMAAPVVILVVVQVWLDLRIPGYMNEITDALQFNTAEGILVEKGWEMLACAIGSFAASAIAAYFAACLGANFSRTLREKEFDNVERFSMGDINRFSTASLITRSTNDAGNIQVIISRGLQMIVKAPVMAIWALAKIWGSNWMWSASTLVAVVVLTSVIICIVVYTTPRFRKIQWLTDDINRVVGDSLEGMRIIRAYDAEDFQGERFDKANDALLKNNLSAVRAMSFLFPTANLIMNLLTMAIYFLGALIIDGTASQFERMLLFSNMIVFSTYAMRAINGFLMLTGILRMLPRVMVSANRVKEVIEHQPSVVGGELSGPADVHGEVEFRNVGFAYPGTGEEVVSDVSFSAHGGETVAIIGSTGSGKSSLVNLIPRFYDVTSGAVLVDGVDVREYDEKALRSRIGYVPQKAIIFSGSVRMNVNYGDTAAERDEEDIWESLRIAQADDFVRKMPEGIDSHISQYGNNLSGGQKQRVSIARAICRRPEIYILDDTFSALDFATDSALRASLKSECAGSTVIIVAQRVGTIMDADRIIVLDEGRIVGTGRHDELLRSCPTYRDIAESQLREGELRCRPEDTGECHLGSPRRNPRVSPNRGNACYPTWAHTAYIWKSPHAWRYSVPYCLFWGPVFLRISPTKWPVRSPTTPPSTWGSYSTSSFC